MRGLVRFAAICLAGLLLSGCLALGDIDRRATSFDEGVGSFQNRAILLNLARASLREPMVFVSVGSTNAVGLEDFRASVPSFGEGPNLSSTTRAFTFSPGGSTALDNQTSTNTQMNVFSTHDFYLGMMEPLTLDEINLLLHQGYERELVFYLTIAKAKITPLDDKLNPNGPPYYIYNDPDGDPTNYEEFAGHIELAMEAGLTTDVAAAGAKSDDSASADKVIAAAPAPGGAKGGVQFVLQGEKQPGPKVVECLDPALQSTRGREFVNALKARKPVRLCGEPEEAARAGAQKNVVYWRNSKGELEAQQIEIVFRSTYEVFRYLGALINEPPAAPTMACQGQQPLHAAPTICDYTAADSPSPIGPLLRVESDGPSCFTAVSYANRRYCIPNGGRELDTTKDVFNILVSLLALKQSPGDLPTPQTVVLQ